MLSAQQRYLIADRCWLIYDLITNIFSVPGSFHLEIHEIAEIALESGYIEIRVQIEKEHLLHIYEEYSFQAHTIIRVSIAIIYWTQAKIIILFEPIMFLITE